MTTISAIIISKNAASTIERCLQSVQWMDEIIVLDSGSDDDTVAICQRYTDQVYVTDWPGFGPQKNRALRYVSSEWVFSIDADEWLDPACQAEIVARINQASPLVAYRMKRRNIYCGKLLKHGDVGRDRVLRLFHHQHGRFSDDVVHERTLIEGPVGELRSVLMHNSYRDFDDILQRMNYYTSLSANMRWQNGQRAAIFQAITHSLWAFFKAYCLRLGFLDGKMGFLVAVTSAQSSFYRLVKLWHRGQHPLDG